MLSCLPILQSLEMPASLAALQIVRELAIVVADHIRVSFLDRLFNPFIIILITNTNMINIATKGDYDPVSLPV